MCVVRKEPGARLAWPAAPGELWPPRPQSVVPAAAGEVLAAASMLRAYHCRRGMQRQRSRRTIVAAERGSNAPGVPLSPRNAWAFLTKLTDENENLEWQI